jgi:DNA-binding winged helix-turn-helix (wHTH) protein
MSVRCYAFGPFILDVDRELLTRDSRPVSVGARGIALLTELVGADGKPVSKSRLLDAAWPDTAVEESNLSVQIAMLRKLLGPTADGSAWIMTVPRVGYRFVGKSRPLAAEPEDSARTSIVVVPLDYIGGDPGREYLADGVTDDISPRWLASGGSAWHPAAPASS